MTDTMSPGTHAPTTGLDLSTLGLMLEALDDFIGASLSPELQLELDHEDRCPEDIVRAMSDPETLGVQLVFIPEEFGGMGGGAWDSYRVCEAMARKDIGLATAVFATFLGSDPIVFGGTPEQQEHWLGRIAGEGLVFAYGATEPEAGSDLGAMTTTAFTAPIAHVHGWRWALGVWGLAAGWWAPRGPLTAGQALLSLGLSVAVGCAAGLVMRAELDGNRYPTATKVRDEELSRVRIKRASFHGDWNYSLLPHPE